MTALAPSINVYNLARMTVSGTPGTGTITLGSAATVGGVTYLSFTAAGVQDGDVVYYGIADAGNSEVGYGTYTASGTTLTRNAITSTNSNNEINATSAAEVFIIAAAEQFTDPTNVATVNLGALAGFRNRVINGAMAIAQRGTSFTSATVPTNNDDQYMLDRWLLLSNGSDTVDVTQSTDAPADGQYSIALDVETTNRKFGIAQIVESFDCRNLIGNTVTLSFKARASSTAQLDNVKAAILAWSSTADAVTSDFVSAWNVEGTNPTLVANWTYENTPANLGVTTSWATYSVTAEVDTASTTNVAIFIWSDVTTTTAGHFLYITDVQLEPGSVATEFERRPIAIELPMCQRFYEKSYAQGTRPGTATSMTIGINRIIETTYVLGGGTVPYLTSKRTSPTLTIYSPDNGATGVVGEYSIASDAFVSNRALFSQGTNEVLYRPVLNNNGTPGAQAVWHYTAEAEM